MSLESTLSFIAVDHASIIVAIVTYWEEWSGKIQENPGRSRGIPVSGAKLTYEVCWFLLSNLV